MAENIVSTLGAGSGIDIKSLVTQLTAVERAPTEQRLDSRKEKIEAQISGYGQLRSAMDSFKGALTALSDPDLFNARTATLPDSDIITANSIDPGAQTGAYKIEVLQTASAHSLAMPAQSERDAALEKSGDLTIQFGDWTYDGGTGAPQSFGVNADRAALTVTIEASDSLDDIATKINAENAGVQATVIKVDTSYQLMLTAESGASNAMRISAGAGSTGLDDFVFDETTQNATETQQGQDARLKVNGLEVFRESNEIDDVIQGFDFTINKAGAPGESLNFSISADKSSAEQVIRDFVTAYNSFQETTSKLFGYSRDEDDQLVRGGLANDSTARSMVERFRSQVGGSVPGLSSGFTALTNVGIRTERDGSLSLNETDFKAALSNNFNLLEGLFTGRSSATNTAVTVKAGTFATQAIAGSYQAEITRDPTHGQTSGTAITAAIFDPATDLFTGVNTAGGGYSFKIQVDGVNSNAIKLTETYDSADELRAELQSRINGDAKLKEAGVGLDVQYDATTNAFSFISREYGSASSVVFTETGEDVGGVWTDNMGVLGIGATAARVQSNAITASGFDGASDSFSPNLDTSSGDYSFKVSVDGVESDTLSLTGTYGNSTDLVNALQAAINGDASLSGAGVGLTVGYDADANRLTFTSNSTGADSSVSFTERSADMASLGIETALSGTRGVDVAGTINGEAGFGAGNVLLPPLGSSVYGLNLSVRPGATAQGAFNFDFARGLAGELENMIQNFTSSTGTVKSREDYLQKQLKLIETERTALDQRMDRYEARLQAQFIAMESIVSSFQKTGSSLEGINDRLPFTASNN
ncbi:flagellar hook-associated protein 2 [Allochromatium warmingii]|uniref:Flagellar hook-associated protein 2 n=1 Tax=Allochromatium warmingii TaxID=61595 RepID=A0A1H3ISK1_ALLWA|nr:flagellar filament capping protein FliD [Allochromatium warmingii]SDY30661.1 flagellar hook-associated protein 2 [Allochromatium warmingii]